MNLRYRLLLAALLTLLGLCYQATFAQTKMVEKDFTIANNAACNCAISVTPLISNVSACNVTDGSVQISITGGSGSFSFLWRNQSGTVVGTSQNLVNVGTGYYFLEIIDNNAPYCGTHYYNYALPTSLSLSATIKDNIGCLTANGSISPTATGGSGNFTYQWRFPDGSTVQTRNIVNVKAGTYYLTATDVVLGCTVARSFNVKSTASLSVTENAKTANTSCELNTGSVDISIGNGSGQYNHYWYNLQTLGIASSTEDLVKAKGGNYSIFATDLVSGCTAYQTFTIEEQTKAPDFIIESITPNTICHGTPNGAVMLTPLGTPGPFEITWTDGTQIVSSGTNPTTLASGTFGFKILDKGTKCFTQISVNHAKAVVIPDASLPTIDVIQDDLKAHTNCGNPNGEIKVSITDPKTPYSFSWTGPNSFTSTNEDLANLAPGVYTLSVKANCNTPPSIQIPEQLKSSEPLLSINLLDAITDSENNLDLDKITIVDEPVSQARATVTSQHTLEIDYSGIKFSGEDKLKVKACDLLNECTESLINITVEQGDVIVYNAVSPNSTGNNKFMRIDNLPDENRVSIFNRWGDKVFDVLNYDNEVTRFDGISRDGKALPSGTYFYSIEFQDGQESLTGYLVLKWL